MEEGELLFKPPRDRKKKCARRVCLLGIGLLIAGMATCLVSLNEIDKRIQGRNYCGAAQRDAFAIGGALADYFVIPSHTSLGPLPIVVGPGRSTRNGISFPALSGKNAGQITGDLMEISISVSDASGRCMMRETTPDWNRIAGKAVFTMILD